MPIHDWSRVDAGIFHDFHCSWIAELRRALNEGILPPEFYALSEQVAGSIGPDVLTLQTGNPPDADGGFHPAGATALAVAPPKVRFTALAEIDLYPLKQRSLAIRHSSNHRLIALIEILSPGNKSGRQAFRALLDKVLSALARGIHLLLVDLQPPTRRDPQGIHGAVWGEILDDTYTAPPDKPFTLVAYKSGPPTAAYVEPVAVGDALADMPLFLDPDFYVNVPLEATYAAAWRGVPAYWKRVLEAPVT